MEILSVGEKIKRARIYKGYTLKKLCDDKISVSKMSCIENGKIKPDDWVINFIAKKLELNVEYLKESIRDQIVKNIEDLQSNKNIEDFEGELEYNLSFSEKYFYFDLCFQILHLMFNYYLKTKEFEKNQLLVSKYYIVCKKSNIKENKYIYNMDIGKYLYKIRQFDQSVVYYNNVIKMHRQNENKFLLAKANYGLVACYIMLKDYEKAYEKGINLKKLLPYIDGDVKKAKVYHMLAILSLRMKKDNFEEYKNLAYDLYGNNSLCKARSIFNYAVIMFEFDIEDKAVEYISKGLEYFPKEDKRLLVKFMLSNVKELIKNNRLCEAQKICDEALDNAIFLDDIKYIEKSYYYKATILQKQGDLINGEIYMNLALDSLLKFSTKKYIHKRYIQMGYMYYKMNNVVESIKYFNLAINMEKKM